MRRIVVVLPIFVICALASSLRIQAQTDDAGARSTPAHHDGSASQEREAEVSSSKDTRIDLSPPANDVKDHPESGAAIIDAEETPSDVQEFHPWDPHKAAKDVEVGDFYFKKKNYRAALDRYKEALIYKPNDAIANFRLAECEEKSGQPSEAIAHYEAYLKILPHGPEAAEAQKSLDKLKASSSKEATSQ